MYQAYLLAGQECSKLLQVKDSCAFYPNLYSDTIKHTVKELAFSERNTTVTTDIQYKGTAYKKGQFLVYSNDEYMEFGELLLILIQNDTSVYVLMDIHKGIFLSEYHLYSVTKDSLGLQWHFFIANMSDSERTFLDVVIMEVLPQLPAENKNILEEHLQSIGVETYDDLRFVTEADLMTALRPVQARKLLSAWKRKYQTPENSSPSSVEALPTQSLSSLSVSPRSSSSTSASSPGLDTQWDDNFEIPWSKFPEEVTHALERGKRPGPKLRRQMVRIVVTEMMEKCPHVGKKHSTDVARKMVAKYPNSLQDVIEGDIVGTGYHSLVKQLQNRIENVRRTSTPKIRKRKHQTDDSDHTDEIPLEERAAMQDTLRMH
ncbi:hypothetical protein L3Q82_001848 [Scortum barcoo]|uniref:Uncharacterized protein n=1 Tax=Scortum barcoo TaxID=214431 RepID=A0ACB8W4J2_9TELE|nr:hypothetical protein L3Q82_001848 [Scortum barcoo]